MQAIERLDKLKLKSIIPADKLRQQIYSMNSIQKSFFKSGLASGNKILQINTKFEKLKNENKIRISRFTSSRYEYFTEIPLTSNGLPNFFPLANL